ncbi:MAG: methionine biosynthesis protein MetW [Terriglobia bacterium]|jgi:methionine biosynthesis protein MetW
MGGLAEEVRLDDAGTMVRLTPDHRTIIDLIPEGSRVMDLGCGEGDLLLALKVMKKVRAEGIELSDACIQSCVAKGLFNVHHGDLDEGLADYPDKSIDYVILTNTIQVLHRPMLLIREMARVSKRCIVSFPNFAHWPVRWQHFFGGRMPKTEKLPYEWYETLNIHLTTIVDFRDFCRKAGLTVLREIPLRTSAAGRCTVVRFLPNLLADSAIFVLEEGDMPLASSGTPH